MDKDIGTSLMWISHACVAIKYDDEYLVTDPWFFTPAFSSWSPCPPPVINPEILFALSSAGKLTVVLSHAHPDHTDIAFLTKLSSSSKIFIPQFSDSHFTDYLASAGGGIGNINLIQDHIQSGPWELRAFPHFDSPTDSAVSIETPSAFVFHGNDAWVLSDSTAEVIKNMLPAKKPNIFMGQGGSASGYPLTYRNLPVDERLNILKEKNRKIIMGLAYEAKRCGFQHALSYACFAGVETPSKSYVGTGDYATGKHCNQVAQTDIFIDLQPGDIFDMSAGRVASFFTPFGISPENYAPLPKIHFSAVKADEWISSYDSTMKSFCRAMAEAISDAAANDADSFDVDFSIIVETPNAKEIAYQIFYGNRVKVAYVSSAIMAAVLDKKIPFEDLSTGYMAEWKREPATYYNRSLLMVAENFGYEYLVS